jgi:hypothetical protein
MLRSGTKQQLHQYVGLHATSYQPPPENLTIRPGAKRIHPAPLRNNAVRAIISQFDCFYQINKHFL